jgi:hypothetical protein
MCHRRWCNHWISREALRQYILGEVDEQRFQFACPECKADACARCALHPAGIGGDAAAAAPHCYVPPRQIRAVLSAEEHNRCATVRLGVQLGRHAVRQSSCRVRGRVRC